ncbi:MAG: Ldh family oxidoreductase [Sulfuriferula sp.]
MILIALDALTALVAQGLERAGAAPENARLAAQFLVAADAQGLASHGVSRTPLYAAHLRNGRVDGRAFPTIARQKCAVCLVDARLGLAFGACAMAVRETQARAREFGVAFSGVTNSNHFGATALHLAPLAEAGMVALAWGNSPAAMPAWGGRTPLFGTNPIAAVFPRGDRDPLVIDLSLSEVARGKIMLAAREGRTIPKGWALDRDGNPTTDPKAALEGSMLPAGGVKGAMLALIIELLSCALTGAAFGFEAESFFSETGQPPRIGQGFLAFDPGALTGTAGYYERVETLISAMLVDPDVRLPGERRSSTEARAREQGIEIPCTLHSQLLALAQV